MNHKTLFLGALALAIAAPAALIAGIAIADESTGIPSRPEGPCDVYAAGGAPCVAAHSSTRALYANYNGPLYQIMRQSDSKTLDIGVVQPSEGDPGGYADAAAHDAFCENTTCWITILYDQSGNGNDLYQAPRGGFSGNSLGGMNNLPMADWAPVTLMGHKVYGVFVVSGTGLRQNDPTGTAVDDQAQGQYWVINGHHYNNRCCFDYGNAEIDSRDDGDGTMATTYYGNAKNWYYGPDPGPWIMTDQENNLVGCVTDSPNNKFCEDLKSIEWRFVTATADGEPHHWRSMGGDAQKGELEVIYDGIRVQNPLNSYDPMRKQGAILLGNGGDNGNGSTGTFYEGAMTAANTFPSIETNQAVQANVVAAGYDVPRLQIAEADKGARPSPVQTFVPKSKGYDAVTFVNTTHDEISDLKISIEGPRRWKAFVKGTKNKVFKADYAVAPGQTVVTNFEVKSGKKVFNGDLKAKATWTASNGKTMTETAVIKVRNVAPVKINEYSTDFIELYNAGTKKVKLDNWTLTHHANHLPYFSSVNILAGTVLQPKQFYLLGMSNAGLAVDAAKGDKVIYVSNVEGMSEGDEIQIGYGKGAETRKIASISVTQPKQIDEASMFGGRGARREQLGTPTTVFQPLPDGAYITIPAGSNNIPVTSIDGMREGGKLALGHGAIFPTSNNSLEKYEVVTITKVGKPGTQAYLTLDAKAGDTNIKVSNVDNISVGDKIRLDINSVGHGIETVTVKAVGTASVRSAVFGGPLRPDEDAGTGLELEEPLKFDHAANLPFAANGTGVTFEPATKYDHTSNEPVLALAYAIELDSPLAAAHPVDDVVYDAKVVETGYHGEVAADLLVGGPAFANEGNMTLRDNKGNIVDAVNYGAIVDPWLAEGYQAESGIDKMGNFAPSPLLGGGRSFGAPAARPTSVNAGRYPDGKDTDDNEADFKGIKMFSLSEAAEAGAGTIVISDAVVPEAGQKWYLGRGNDREEVQVASVSAPRRIETEMMWGNRARKVFYNVIDVTLAKPLGKAHASGTGAINNVPTPGKPNSF